MRNQILAFTLSAFAFTAAGATLKHNYDLTSSLNDLLGGPALGSDGGTLSASGYAFAANQGLNLSSALVDPANYSLLFDYSFSTLIGFRKQVDFKDRTSDLGLYNLNAALNFFNFATGPGSTFSANVLSRVVLTRDTATNTVTGYVNGVQQLQFVDSGLAGVFSATNNIIRFFEDDFNTGQGESSAGNSTRIAIYDGALTANEAGALGGPGGNSNSPEPSSLVLLAAGALGMGVVKLRRK